MNILLKTFDNSLDRFRKIRLGQIVSDINDNGEVDVNWLDGEAGGQSRISITYPAFNNNDIQPWGVELGFGRGMVGVFGFITDNHAVILGCIISKVKGKQVGYDKTNQIKTGEFRIRSKNGAEVYWNLAGDLVLSTGSLSLTMNEVSKKIEMSAPEGLWVNGVRIG